MSKLLDPGASADRIAETIEDLISQIPTKEKGLVRQILSNATQLCLQDSARLDLKIANAAIKEMAEAFDTFAPYSNVPKVTIFGSARTRSHESNYQLAESVAKHFANSGWMVVTGAGPGIMEAATLGAGRDNSLGVSIRLPFEPEEQSILHNDPKKVSMKYFFTRKLALVKESLAFISLPGGFGTLDETFELLTLLQTGKADPVPLVLLDSPEEPFWDHLVRFLQAGPLRQAMVDPDDFMFFRQSRSAQDCFEIVKRFYSNYQGMRWHGELMTLWLKHPPSAMTQEALSESFADICTQPGIWDSSAKFSDSAPHSWFGNTRLSSVSLHFDKRSYGRLFELIGALNNQHQWK